MVAFHDNVLGVVTFGHVLDDVGRSLRQALYMLWQTLWALVLGFGLSGAVQAFAPQDQLRSRLGDHRPASVARASMFGAASSSCSYAASAVAKSLVAGGADFVAAMVFMFASTNLVIELGIVLAVLIGWQFVAAELAGGTMMVVLLAIAGGLWLRGRALAEARAKATARAQPDGGSALPGTGHVHGAPPAVEKPPPTWRRARAAAGWSDAAGYTIGDITMLRKEILTGFVVAGFLDVLVPTHVWEDLFLHGHGLWTTLENVAIGPFVAVISFVCSVGNVPLAAALWHGGTSFGGVVSFIFADLITLPLLLIYRKQYGARMAGRMLVVFWVVMSVAGLACQGLADVFGLPLPSRSVAVGGGTVHWGYTTALDIAALVALVCLYWLYRNRGRFGGGTGYAKDPVCGMQVDLRHPPASADYGGQRYYFCSEHCRDRYISSSRQVTP